MQNNLMQMVQMFKSNPIGMISQRYNIPQGMNQPQDIIQHLLNTGQVTQEQVNQAMQMRNDPQIKQLLGL